MGKGSFLLYTSIYEPIKDLTDGQMGRLFRAIILYNLQEPYEVGPDIKMAFQFIQQQIDASDKKYQEAVEKRSRKVRGRKGGKRASKKNRIDETDIEENTEETV